MSKHTPGLWVARPDPHGNPNDCCIGLPDDITPHDYVAVCHNRDGALIAAAPDLLAALEGCIKYVAFAYSAGILGAEEAGRAAEAAIAKATGEDK